eukprot:8873823-Pyramimonas_sp.AAC.1
MASLLAKPIQMVYAAQAYSNGELARQAESYLFLLTLSAVFAAPQRRLRGPQTNGNTVGGAP